MARVNQLQSGIRHAPISPELAALLNSVGEEANVYFDVTSGGQNSTTGHTGSHRHDEGNAADVKAYTLGADGSKHYLDQSNPADNAIWKQIVQLSVAGGATGIGAGPDYMGNLTAHIGFGKPAVWGAGGHTVNAPEWLKTAYNSGEHTPPGSIPQVATALDTIDRVVPRPKPSGIASAYAAPSVPPMPQARPQNIASNGFNMAPPNLPLNAPVPQGRGSSYGPETPNWAPSVANLGMPPVPNGIVAPTVNEARAEQMQGRGLASLPAFVSEDHPRSNVGILAPTPMPGRPPDAIAAPPVPVQAQPAPIQRQAPVAAPTPSLRLASGKTIAPGIYTQADGHSVQVSDAGDGTAKITKIVGPGTIPGLINPLREVNANTVAGGMIRNMLPGQLGGNVSAFVPTVGNNIKSAALGAVNNLGTSIGSAFSGLGGLFQPSQPKSTGLAALPPTPMSRPANFYTSSPKPVSSNTQALAKALSDKQGRNQALAETLNRIGAGGNRMSV